MAQSDPIQSGTNNPSSAVGSAFGPGNPNWQKLIDDMSKGTFKEQEAAQQKANAARNDPANKQSLESFQANKATERQEQIKDLADKKAGAAQNPIAKKDNNQNSRTKPEPEISPIQAKTASETKATQARADGDAAGIQARGAADAARMQSQARADSDKIQGITPEQRKHFDDLEKKAGGGKPETAKNSNTANNNPTNKSTPINKPSEKTQDKPAEKSDDQPAYSQRVTTEEEDDAAYEKAKQDLRDKTKVNEDYWKQKSGGADKQPSTQPKPTSNQQPAESSTKSPDGNKGDQTNNLTDEAKAKVATARDKIEGTTPEERKKFDDAEKMAGGNKPNDTRNQNATIGKTKDKDDQSKGISNKPSGKKATTIPERQKQFAQNKLKSRIGAGGPPAGGAKNLPGSPPSRGGNMAQLSQLRAGQFQAGQPNLPPAQPPQAGQQKGGKGGEDGEGQGEEEEEAQQAEESQEQQDDTDNKRKENFQKQGMLTQMMGVQMQQQAAGANDNKAANNMVAKQIDKAAYSEPITLFLWSNVKMMLGGWMLHGKDDFIPDFKIKFINRMVGYLILLIIDAIVVILGTCIIVIISIIIYAIFNPCWAIKFFELGGWFASKICDIAT